LGSAFASGREILDSNKAVTLYPIEPVQMAATVAAMKAILQPA
jgi:hypothetical protein